MKIYNTLTRVKEEFIPISKGVIKMYACGITPYDEIHIGHAVQAVVYDVMNAYFQYRGYEVNYVRNYTDVDDKIIKRANDEGKESTEVSSHFMKENSLDLDHLKVHKAGHEPKVTECIPDIIEYIQVLLDKGFAYVVDGEVFFDIDKYTKYGHLSNRKREDLINSEVSPNKRNNNDFVLWKPHKEGEPFWEAPWSKGRPGWHIECSVMAHKYLGDSIDIHGGGLDLLFPHHENEIAQSEAYSGKTFAKYWVHNGLVMIDGTKMSKSLGNFMTVKEALKDFFPEEIRYAILTHKYSSAIDFSDDLFRNVRKRLYYFYSTLAKMNEVIGASGKSDESATVPENIAKLESRFIEFMDDDFNSPRVISELADIFKDLNKVIISSKYSPVAKKYIFETFFKSFGTISKILRLFEEDPREYIDGLKKKVLADKNVAVEYINEKLSERQSAKETKDYETADKISSELRERGISIQDSPDSVTWDIIF